MASDMFILYVTNQVRAAAFYREVLETEPVVDVPGITEFELPGGGMLGLMPAEGIRRLLPGLPVPASAGDGPRCEVYLAVEDPADCYRRALEAGAVGVDPVSGRDWGDDVGYVLDPDGHVLAFAAPAT